MSPEEKSLLERTYKMAEENNEILKSIRRTARLGTAMKLIYWIVIVGLSIGAFYFIQPYIEFMKSTLGIGGTSNDSTTPPDGLLKNLQGLLK